MLLRVFSDIILFMIHILFYTHLHNWYVRQMAGFTIDFTYRKHKIVNKTLTGKLGKGKVSAVYTQRIE